MEYYCELKIKGNKEDIDRVYKSLLPESGSSERITVSLSREDDNVRVMFKSKDPIILRATFNSIARLLSVEEAVNQFEG